VKPFFCSSNPAMDAGSIILRTKPEKQTLVVMGEM